MTSDKAAVKPVAWRRKTYEPWMESYAWVFAIREGDVRPDHEPLYSAETIAQLQTDHAAALQAARDEIESLKHEAEQKDQAIAKSYAREKLAERRVAELGATLRGIFYLDPEEDSDNGLNEWGEADCFRIAQLCAEAALAPAKKVD